MTDRMQPKPSIHFWRIFFLMLVASALSAASGLLSLWIGWWEGVLYIVSVPFYVWAVYYGLRSLWHDGVAAGMRAITKEISDRL